VRSKHESTTGLGERLYDFALKIVMLVRALPKEIAAYELGKQLIRSGTSIAANYEEARCGYSKDDFTSLLSKINFKK